MLHVGEHERARLIGTLIKGWWLACLHGYDSVISLRR